MTRARPTLKQLVKKISPARLGDYMKGLNTLLKDPFGPESDRFMDEVVDRYNQKALNAMMREDVLLIPNAWQWYRALQVRFVQLGCADRSSIDAAVRKELSVKPRPRIDRLMRAVFRQTMLDLFAYGKANKDLPPSKRAPHPKGGEALWDEAWNSLNTDMKREVKGGRTADEAPKEWFLILGKDYSRKSMPL